MEVCPTWAERRVLMEAIGDGVPSHPALVKAMVRGGPEVAVTSFAKQTYGSTAARGDARCDKHRATISGHRRRGFAGGEQWVARRLLILFIKVHLYLKSFRV